LPMCLSSQRFFPFHEGLRHQQALHCHNVRTLF
jgi:hypothetical protein